MGKRLFVRNLPFSTNDTELREIFGRAGNIESATVMMDRATGRSRGFGFVEMATDEEAQRAIRELEGYELGGRNLSVSEARERGERPAFGSGGGYRPAPNLGYGGSGFNDAAPKFPKEGGSRRGLRGKKRSL
jgi:RNA recognition motif-containing protein